MSQEKIDADLQQHEDARFVLGVGIASVASEGDVFALAGAVLREAGIEASSLDAIATLDRRADHPALVALAARFEIPLWGVTSERLAGEVDRMATPSEKVKSLVGLAGVAEAAALASSGANARLVVEKRTGEGVTMALAIVARAE